MAVAVTTTTMLRNFARCACVCDVLHGEALFVSRQKVAHSFNTRPTRTHRAYTYVDSL